VLNKITLALVISKPGHLRNGLQSLLRTVPQIKIIAESQEPSNLLDICNEIHPDLIIIDASIFEESNWTAIIKIKSEWPQTKIVVLTENNLQKQRAKKAGADFFLPEGFPAVELVNLIENSLIHDTPEEANLGETLGVQKESQ